MLLNSVTLNMKLNNLSFCQILKVLTLCLFIKWLINRN